MDFNIKGKTALVAVAVGSVIRVDGGLIASV
jgi:hypothetical protein